MNASTTSPAQDLLSHTLAFCDDCLNRQDFTAAWQALSRAVSMAPNRADVLIHRGRLALFLKDTETAQRDFAAALKIDPRCSAALSGLARCYMQQADPTEAEAAADLAMGIDPADEEAAQVKAEIQAERRSAQPRRLSSMDSRATPAERGEFVPTAGGGPAPGFNDRDEDALKILADWNLGQQRYQEAALTYGKLIDKEPARVELYLSLAKCFFELGDQATAESALERALHLEPHNQLVQDNLSALRGLKTQALPAALPARELPPVAAIPKGPPAVLVICHVEHGQKFMGLLSDQLSRAHPAGEILCLLPSGEPALEATVKELQANHPRLKSVILPSPSLSAEQLGQVLNEHIAGRKSFWLKGDASLYKLLKDPRSLPIQAEESLLDFLDEEAAAQAPAPYPTFANIALTSKCHYKCFFCKRGEPDPAPHLPFATLVGLRKLIEGVEIVDITSPGESLLYPQIREAIEFITSHNQKQGIQVTTTGLLLTEELAVLLSKRLYQLTISLNAASPECYERDMGSKRWRDVLENIRAARRHIPREKIALSCVVHRDNLDELPAFIDLAAELDVWHVRLVSMLSTKPANIRKTLWFCRDRAHAAVEQAKRAGAARNIIVSDMYETVQQKSNSAHVNCIMPTFGTYIRLDGEVWPCCYAHPQVMGSIHHPDGFDGAWNGRKYRRLRQHNYFTQCRNCPAVHPSMDRLEDHIASYSLAETKAQLPLISVVVPECQTPDQIRQALSGLKSQTYPVWEAVFVMGPGMVSETREELREQARSDDRIRCLETGENLDFYGRVNTALRHVRGQPCDSFIIHLPASRRSFESHFSVFESLGEEYAATGESRHEDGLLDFSQTIFRTRALQRLQGFDLATANPEADLIERFRAGSERLCQVPRELVSREAITREQF